MTYGKEVVRTLAECLAQEFGRGFSKTNLEYMRRFFLLYRERGAFAQFETGHSRTDRVWERPSPRVFQLPSLKLRNWIPVRLPWAGLIMCSHGHP